MFVSLPVGWKIKPLTNIIFRFCVIMNVLILVICNDGCCVPIKRPDFTEQDRTGPANAKVKITAFFISLIT
jgi:hypothetical protein